jgi:DNA-binding CsgD family transcriptional regulator
MAVRVSSPRFVGRSSELEQIDDAIERAKAGEGPFLIVGGEAGVGKTRLFEEATDRARRGGAVTAVGRCIDLTGGLVPLAPVTQVLRELRRAAERQPMGTSDSEEHFRAIDDLSDSSASGERVGLASDSRQVRFLEAWLDLLESLGEARPLLIVIEDIHWADRSTLDWLTYIARGRTRTRFTVAATIRTDELHRRHPVQPFLAELQRMPSVLRLELARFDRAEVAEQIAAISGAVVDAKVVDRIYRRSNGNAFFSEELLAGSGGEGPLPAGLRDTILARVTGLDGDTGQLLRIASVAGDRFSSTILARVTGAEVEHVERLLRDPVDHQVVLPVADAAGDHFAFRHSLVREAIYADLLPGERARLHGRFAAAIEEDSSSRSDRSGELALHWLAAYDLPRAFHASVAAARSAEKVHGYAEAQQHYDRVIELWDRVPDADARAGMDRVSLLERAASAASMTDLDRAMALATMAIQAAPVSAEPMRMALLKERFGQYAWLVGDGVTALESCRDAARLVEAEPPTRDHARVLASLGQILMVTADMEAGGPIASEAVEIARSVAARDVETHALTTLGVCTAYLGDLEGGLAQLGAALEMARQIDSVDDIDRANANLVDVLTNSAEFRQASDIAITASDLAAERGLGRVRGAWQLAEGGLALYRLGDWAGARDLLERALAQRPTGAPLIAAEQRLAMIDVGQGRFDEANERLTRVRPLIERVVEAQLITPMTEAATELALWENRPQDARDAVAETLARVPRDRANYISRIGPILALAARAQADIATLKRARRDLAGAAEARIAAEADLDAMRRLRDEAHVHRPNFVSQADAWLALCYAEMTRLRAEAHPPAWLAATAAFAAIPMPYLQAYSAWRLGEASLMAGRRRRDATAFLREAYDLARPLTAGPLLAEIDALARRARIDLEVELPAAHREPPAADDSLGLTRREHEVLQLIAAGRSNREIAQRLFITEGTAGTHVSNILGKLGVRGRTEAAAIAHRLSMVEQSGRRV